LTDGHQTALKILRENMDVLHRLAQALLEKETIDGSEVDMIVGGGTLDDITRERERKAENSRVAQQQEASSAAQPGIVIEPGGTSSTGFGGRDPIGSPA
jgi:cell division protease FtsH